jgi:hypothetical protein
MAMAKLSPMHVALREGICISTCELQPLLELNGFLTDARATAKMNIHGINSRVHEFYSAPPLPPYRL